MSDPSLPEPSASDRTAAFATSADGPSQASAYGPSQASAPAKIRILLADDHALVRRGVRLILDREPDLEVVAEAGDGAEAIDMARAHEADLAVLDIAMPRLTGLQAARELAALK
ncbi:response regulator transcription factor, partial [Streptomyces sp. PU10]